MKILVTAFEPFGGETINSAQLAVARLPCEIADAEIVTLLVPTEFGRSIRVVAEAIDHHTPDAVLCVGQAGGRPDVTPERVAINVDDAHIPDNAGAQPLDTPIVDGAPAAYFATLPVKAMVQAIGDSGVPSSLSNSAGTFVCNHLMYGLLHHVAITCPQTRVGFLHVPFVPKQVVDKPGVPALSLDDITRAVTAAIRVIATHDDDVVLAAGTTH